MTLRYASNLTLLYPEVPFLERFARAAASGFRTVEFQFPYEAGVDAVRARLQAHDLEVVLFNGPPGDTSAGELGLLSVPYRRDDFRRSVDVALDAARRLGSRYVHLMVGNRVEGLDPEAQVECAVRNLEWAAPLGKDAGVIWTVEALNPTDFPRYLVHTTTAAVDLLRAVDDPNVRLQYDVYHAQMAEGNLINTFTAHLALIVHVQIADVPGRHQPGTGEINYPAIFAALGRLGYEGHIGLEYRPDGDTDATLSWLPREARASRV